MDDLVGAPGHDVLFYEQLQTIGNRLKYAPTSDAVRSEPVLDSAQRLAFDQRRVGKDAGEYGKDEQDGNGH
jgi:hypothetical protein